MRPEVLIIDDEWAVSRAISARLEASGFEVRTAVNGLDGLAAIEASRPDAVLLDLRMPDIDGLEVLRRLRADDRNAGLPVIMLTANVQDSLRGEALALGARGFFGKPFDHHALVAALRRATTPTADWEGVAS
ncbi:MAG: response regulator [Phycisphaerales bacterium]|jgi:DNA-binding response OmpR family regulator|nr:response regulator [Planctomycetota bacterium]